MFFITWTKFHIFFFQFSMFFLYFRPSSLTHICSFTDWYKEHTFHLWRSLCWLREDSLWKVAQTLKFNWFLCLQWEKKWSLKHCFSPMQAPRFFYRIWGTCACKYESRWCHWCCCSFFIIGNRMLTSYTWHIFFWKRVLTTVSFNMSDICMIEIVVFGRLKVVILLHMVWYPNLLGDFLFLSVCHP